MFKPGAIPVHRQAWRVVWRPSPEVAAICHAGSWHGNESHHWHDVCWQSALRRHHTTPHTAAVAPSLPAPKPDIGTQVNKRILLRAFTACSKAWHRHTGKETNITSCLHFLLQSPDIGTQVNKRILLHAFTACSKAWHQNTGQQTNITSRLHCLLQSLTSEHRSTNEYYFVPSLPAPKANIGTQVNKKYYSMRAFIAILSRQLTVSRVQSLHITVIKLAYWNKQ